MGYQEFKALKELVTVHPSSVLKSVLNPRANFLGDYTENQISSEVPINRSQKRTVGALKFALENIQGPPGLRML
jgi:hypothetical protein